MRRRHVERESVVLARITQLACVIRAKRLVWIAGVAWVMCIACVSCTSRPARAEGDATREGSDAPTPGAPLDLVWVAPPSCPDRSAIAAGVERLVTTYPPGPLRVTATARPEEGAWNVDLAMEGVATGSRSIRASTCEAAARATALIVALALDPRAAERAAGALAQSDDDVEREGPAQTTTVATPSDGNGSRAPVERQDEPPASASPDAARLLVLAHATVGVERALLPDVAVYGAIGGGIAWRWLRADVTALFAAPSSVALERARNVGADLSHAAGLARACAGRTLGVVQANVCAGVRGTRVAGEGRGGAPSYRRAAWIMSLEPGVLARVPARSAIAAELDVAAVVPLARPDFVILGEGDASSLLFRAPAVGVRAGLAASVRF